MVGLQAIEQIVGKKISELRTAKGWSQEELAHRAGLNRTHLYRLEGGLQSMTLSTLKAISDALGTRMTDLLRGL